MRIQHNIPAMSSYRNYTTNVKAVNKNLEKLSSGYKINRAGDDAAGLAISEKMRAQITGLQTAQKNAKDGISLVKTAEGALQEVHDMLNRMVSLATQSANGTYDNEVDRLQLQKEVDQLRTEINRIADSSNFNGIKLLDGSMDGASKAGTASNISVTAIQDGDQSVREGQAPVYSFDVKDLKVLGGADGTFTLTSLTIMGQALASFANATFTADTFDATAFAASIAAHGGGSLVDANGMKYTLKAEGTKVTLTAVSVPTTATSLAAGTTVALAYTPNGTANSTNNSFDLGMHIEKQGETPALRKVAQGSFVLNTGHVKDGTQLTIGKDTYTFKVGKNSTVSGSNIIDLSDYEDGDSDIVRAAATKLSQMSNNMFDITTATQTKDVAACTIHLTEKVDAVDYKKDWNLKGANATGAADAAWNSSVSDPTVGVVRIAAATAGSGNSLTLQIGDTADSYNQLKVNIGDIHTDALKIDKIAISDQTSAAAAVDAIKSAINQVSDIRGTLGATQNRLEHTINNLSVMTENIQDAESTIRDVDIAEEMMSYTKNNILVQSAQAMLAQANQIPQGVLQLLG